MIFEKEHAEPIVEGDGHDTVSRPKIQWQEQEDNQSGHDATDHTPIIPLRACHPASDGRGGISRKAGRMTIATSAPVAATAAPR